MRRIFRFGLPLSGAAAPARPSPKGGGEPGKEEASGLSGASSFFYMMDDRIKNLCARSFEIQISDF
jgi:hypothetical protein